MKKSVYIPSVRIDPEIYKSLKEISKVNNISIKKVVNGALRKAVLKIRQDRVLELIGNSSFEQVMERNEALLEEIRSIERKIHRVYTSRKK